MTAITATATEHYPAQFAAEGGHGADLPRTSYPLLGDLCTGAMGIAFDQSRAVWVITDADGQVFAEAVNPGDLVEWMSEYIERLGDMHDRGEL